MISSSVYCCGISILLYSSHFVYSTVVQWIVPSSFVFSFLFLAIGNKAAMKKCLAVGG